MRPRYALVVQERKDNGALVLQGSCNSEMPVLSRCAYARNASVRNISRRSGGIKLYWLARMAAAQQKIATAFQHRHHGVVHIKCDQARVPSAEARFQLSHPLQHVGKRQRMRRGEIDSACA